VQKTLSLLILLLSVTTIMAQGDASQPGYKKFPTIPPFTLLNIDSTNITRDNLAKRKNTLIMVFSPSCDHCRHQTDSMLAHMDKLKNVEILMTTYQPLEELSTFYKEYQLAKYPNIKTGRDTHYFFVPFYKVANLPFMALYDEKGKLITTYEGTTSVQKLLQSFKGS
jgi:cytochrome oxidase Cu insertion factor (SCO1/SenC/PrrC family)